MTALWATGNGTGDGFSLGDGDGWGNGDGYGSGLGDGDGWGNGDGYGSGWGDGVGYGSGDGDGDGNGDSGLGYGYPEQAYDGCTAIGRSRIHEATLPVADLLALAVTQ